jgi:hypothetical protein
MPRASTYRDAAHDLRGISARLADLAIAHRSLDAAAIGALGPVADRHDDALAEVGRDLATAADELLRLAAVCERRAIVCEEYARRVTEYWTQPVLERSASVPSPPARWAAA